MDTQQYEEFPCDICGMHDAVEVPHAREYTGGQPVHICMHCGFVYVKQRRSAGAIADVWSDQIFGSGYTAAIPAVQARLTFVAEFINEKLKLQGKKVCDIGAGEGDFLDMIRQSRLGASVFGIEPSKKNCERMQSMGIENFIGTAEEYAVSSYKRAFDIATITWTIENCQSPRKMLEIVHDLLSDGGHVVIATGSRILVPFKKPLSYYLGKNPSDSHSFRFSARTLEALLAVSHFEVVSTNRYIDHDILCVIARKKSTQEQIPWSGDNYLDVHHFFERWHNETALYYPSEQQ